MLGSGLPSKVLHKQSQEQREIKFKKSKNRGAAKHIRSIYGLVSVKYSVTSFGQHKMPQRKEQRILL